MNDVVEIQVSKFDAFEALGGRVTALEALASLLEALAILGQVADQVNGGQIALRGGTLDDPALRVGTVGIYSSATDTLSISIAGSEVARFTAAGVTIFGTVTEA